MIYSLDELRGTKIHTTISCMTCKENIAMYFCVIIDYKLFRMFESVQDEKNGFLNLLLFIGD